MNVKQMICVVAVAFATTAWAADMAPPAWRGQFGTSYQAWGFDTDADPAAPDISVNVQGQASADVNVGDFGSGWMHDGLGGSLTGYWDLGSVGDITVDIPNPATPSAYQEVWVQFTYYFDGGMFMSPMVTVPGAQQVGAEQVLQYEHTVPFGDWMVSQTLWRLEPNPGNVQVVVTSELMGGVVDSIIVDTIVPEPASALLIGLMAAGFVVRRHRA